jgi:P-type Cu+ transporter
MAGAPEVVQLPIAGMTCEHCVGTVRRALEGVPGVQSAAVDLKTGRAAVTLDPERADRARLKGAVEAAGYSVPDRTGPPPAHLVTIGLGPMPAPPPAPPESAPEEWNLAIGGMHCASCVARVEGALAQVPGVREARVNLATERASVVVDPARVDVDRLAEAVARAGYSARRAELEAGMGAEALRRERAEQVAYWRRRLVVGVALAVPLVVLGYAPMLAPRAWGHAAWVAWVMLALAAVLQAYLGGPYLKGAWRRLKQGSSNMDTLIALGTSTAFGFSVVQLLAGHAGPSRFLWGAAGVAIAVAISLAGAVLFGDPPRFAEGRSSGEPIIP